MTHKGHTPAMSGGDSVTQGRDHAFCEAVWDALKSDSNDLRKQQRILEAHRIASTRKDKATIDELRGALRSLAGNAGALRAFEHEIREVTGSTNWQCLMDAIAKADAALARTGDV